MTRIKTILLFLLTVASLMSEGQVFPVQSTVQLTPPYSLYLSDYAAPGSERLRVTAFLIDATRPELNVRFRLRIEGNGIKIETKPEFMPPPVTLLGGVPLQLISSDLAAYFDPRNLNFTGITQREIEQRGALPEGLYQFCFEVIEYNRGVKISNTGCAVAWLILNDPPIVNVPADNEKIRIQDPQQVIFQWTPRHRGTPNSAFNAEYDFKLVEVWPSTRNPNDAILTSPVIFQTTTSETTIIYGPAETPLEPGRRYAFQLRAHAYAGADELSLFKNNGYSQVYTFVYGDACLPPKNISVSDVGTTRFNVSWDGASNQTTYALRYRFANTGNWYTNQSLTPNVTVNSLQPNTRYEFQVNAGCGTFTSDYSLVTNVTTKDNPGIQYSCGVPLTPFNLDPSQLINSLKIGDVIKAGDFDVVLSKVSGSNGTFSGEGVIEVSYFNQAKVKAEFTNINVNNEMRMVNGYMNVTGAGVEVIPAGVMALMDDLSETLNKIDQKLDSIERNLPQQFDENAAVTSTLITVPGTATVTPGSNGSVVIVDGSGKRTEVPAGTTASVVDSSGKGYIIDSKGKVHTTTAAIATAAAKREYNLKLKFAEAQDQKFGFDAKRYDPIASTYTKVEDQYLSWKSVATGQADNVIAQLEGTGIDKSKIRFELNGAMVNSQWSLVNGGSTSMTNDQSTISILGAGDGVESELIALYDAQAPVTNDNSPVTKTQVLGKLSVITYDQIVKDLVIVPVNGNKYPYSEDVLRTQLNKIYGQAVVKWNITFASNFDVPGIDPFDDGGSGLLSNYSPDMRKVVNAYKANLQPNTYYLFLVKNPKRSTLAGFMPRSKECGFIFVDKNGSEEAIVRTIAHELGHGAFTLQHPFADEKYTMKPQGSTNNLMDYTLSGTALYKYQWDRMRYPEIVMGLFEDDKDSENRINDGIDLVGNIITRVVFGVPGRKLVGTLDKDRPYLRTGYREYTDDESKTLLASYNAFIEAGKVVYRDASSKEMPYSVEVSSSGNAMIAILNDQCTYSICNLTAWVKPSDPTSIKETIKLKINEQKPNWETLSLFKPDASCTMINSLLSLISKDKNSNQCSILKIESDSEKLEKLFARQSFTNDELTGLVYDGGVCLAALRRLTWENLSKGIEQLGNSSESIWEKREITILRLMSAINSSNYKDFIALLEKADNKLLLNLISKIQDKSINPWDGDNFTSFISGLCAIYKLKPEIWIERIKPFTNTDLIGQVVSLAPFKFSAPSNGPIIDILMPALGEAKFEGDLNGARVEIKRYVKYLVSTTSPNGSISVPSWVKDDDFDPVQLSPLDPIIILTKQELPLVESVINGIEPIGENLCVVPAIFLQYKTQKEFNDAVEKGVMITFDAITIATSGGVALATKVTWARRIWAITEIVAAGSNIAINTGSIDPNSNYAKTVNAFNVVMAVVGLKNAAKGVKNVIKNIPDYVNTAIQNKQSLRLFLSVQIQTFKKYLADLKRPGGGWDNLDDATKQKLSQQEEFVELLDDQANYIESSKVVASNNGIISGSLNKLIGKASSENISWKNLDETNLIWANPNTNVLSNAKSFANETGTSLYDAVLTDGYYVKFDLDDGRILLGNTNGNYNAFAVFNDDFGAFKSSVLNVSDDVFKTKLSDLLLTNSDKLKVLSGVVSRQLTISGRTVSLSTSKVTTILGRFRPDIANLLNEFGSFKNVGLGETKGGINILNKPDYYYDASSWWSAYNKPWLEKAIERGDDIYLATIPTKADIVDAAGNLKGAYAQELNYLATKGYKPKNVSEAEFQNIKNWLGIKHANWIEVTDITNKVIAKKSHVLRIDINASNTGFNGCHSKIALDDYIANNRTATFEFRNKVMDASGNGVYEANPVIKLQNGTELVKTNNAGKSTFFPDAWNEAKILDEVEYAIANNNGKYDPTKPGSNEYFGLSSDGKVEIHFYYMSDGAIGSYFPAKN
ncbi:MAG: hypothetical protein HOP30_02110 [Cyclobacteriaceae bacterium]|nr:hypothetical protein [Cyclobacteriaceae bacterium]